MKKNFCNIMTAKTGKQKKGVHIIATSRKNYCYIITTIDVNNLIICQLEARKEFNKALVSIGEMDLFTQTGPGHINTSERLTGNRGDLFG